MKISKLALIALLGGALMAFGCSDDSSGTAGSGGGGTGGEGGTGGGTGGTGGGGMACSEPPASMCMNGEIGETTPCCELPIPPSASVCLGDESLVNPASCTETGTVVIHQLTQFEILGDCNVGYDLDGCNGESCSLGGLAPGEGMDGNDNALAGLAPVLSGVGGNLDGVNQALSDALCGVGGDACDETVTTLDLKFGVDANLDENCATVDLIVDGAEVGTVLLNVSDPVDGAVCASGTIGTIPVELGGTNGSFGNAVIQMTISEGGFSDGKLGATVDATTAVAIAEGILTGAGAVVGQVFDINENLEGDSSTPCNALSGTYLVGGVVAAPAPQ